MRRRPRDSAGLIPDPPPAGPAPDPEHAWKALALVNDWVKHAETKIAASLAATGISAGVLFNLVKDRHHPSVALIVIASVCGFSVVVAGTSALIGLYPRIQLLRNRTDDTVNPLFFHDVAQAYKGDAATYGSVLHTLTTNTDDLVRHLGAQVHANATVAHRKYVWANRAIRALILDLLALGALAATIALQR
jgi:hypothetical protein